MTSPRSNRWANRALKLAVGLAILGLTLAYLYENARTDAIIEGHQSLQQAEIGQNGETLAQAQRLAEARFEHIESEIAQLQAAGGNEQAEIDALKAQMQSLAAQLQALSAAVQNIQLTPGPPGPPGRPGPPGPPGLPGPTVQVQPNGQIVCIALCTSSNGHGNGRNGGPP